MERDTTVLEAGTGDSPNPRSDDNDDDDDIEQRKVSEVPNRDTKTNNFQNRRTEFRTKVNLNKEKCIEEIPPLT
jgi:hypothetical protein